MSDNGPPVIESHFVRRWGDMWRTKVAERGLLFFAFAPTVAQMPRAVLSNNWPIPGAPNPEHVDHSFSAVFAYGWRWYAFRNQLERDLFCEKYAEAVECEDPL